MNYGVWLVAYRLRLVRRFNWTWTTAHDGLGGFEAIPVPQGWGAVDRA